MNRRLSPSWAITGSLPNDGLTPPETATSRRGRRSYAGGGLLAIIVGVAPRGELDVRRRPCNKATIVRAGSALLHRQWVACDYCGSRDPRRIGCTTPIPQQGRHSFAPRSTLLRRRGSLAIIVGAATRGESGLRRRPCSEATVPSRRGRRFYAGGGLLAIYCRNLDPRRVGCTPQALQQGHNRSRRVGAPTQTVGCLRLLWEPRPAANWMYDADSTARPPSVRAEVDATTRMAGRVGLNRHVWLIDAVLTTRQHHPERRADPDDAFAGHQPSRCGDGEALAEAAPA